jgi:hypothetical protein
MKIVCYICLWEFLDKGQMDNCRCFSGIFGEARAAIKEGRKYYSKLEKRHSREKNIMYI